MFVVVMLVMCAVAGETHFYRTGPAKRLHWRKPSIGSEKEVAKLAAKTAINTAQFSSNVFDRSKQLPRPVKYWKTVYDDSIRAKLLPAEEKGQSKIPHFLETRKHHSGIVTQPLRPGLAVKEGETIQIVPGEVTKRVLKLGHGPLPDSTSMALHFSVSLLDGSVLLSTRDKDPVKVDLQDDGMNNCWKLAVPTLQVGERARVMCSSVFVSSSPQFSEIPDGQAVQFDMSRVQ